MPIISSRQTRDVNTAGESRLPEGDNENNNNENVELNNVDSDDESNEDTVVVLDGAGNPNNTNNTNNNNNNNNNNTNTVITNSINTAANSGGGAIWNADAPLWALGPINSENRTEERLETIRVKLRDLQRQSCRQFCLLCLVPTVLMSVVIWAIVADLGHCGDDVLTTCSRERRTFINAYTSRCICRAVRLNSG